MDTIVVNVVRTILSNLNYTTCKKCRCVYDNACEVKKSPPSLCLKFAFKLSLWKISYFLTSHPGLVTSIDKKQNKTYPPKINGKRQCITVL